MDIKNVITFTKENIIYQIVLLDGVLGFAEKELSEELLKAKFISTNYLEIELIDVLLLLYNSETFTLNDTIELDEVKYIYDKDAYVYIYGLTDNKWFVGKDKLTTKVNISDSRVPDYDTIDLEVDYDIKILYKYNALFINSGRTDSMVVSHDM